MIVDAPKAGYWVRAIRYADEVEPDPIHFAFRGFPDNYLAGRTTFIINEGNTIFKKGLGHARGIEIWPTDDELKAGWSKLD